MDSAPNSATETPSQAHGFFGAIAGAFASARQVLGNLVELITLEARRAGLTLMWMVALGTIAAVLLVCAWLGFMAALAMWAVSLGMTWAGAITLVASLNLFSMNTTTPRWSRRYNEDMARDV